MNSFKTGIRVAFMLLIVLAFSGCKSKKALVSDQLDSRITGKVLEQVLQKQLDYKSLEIKGSAKTNANGEKYNLGITYRNLADSLIWISARASLGIEVARIICTKDSVWIHSRIMQVKEKGDWRTMSDMVGYPIDFTAFQGIMARKLFVPGTEENRILTRYLTRKNENGQLMIPDFSDQEQKIILADKGFLPQFLIDTRSGILLKTKISPEDPSWLMEVQYGTEALSSLMGLPSELKLEATDMEEKMEVEIKIQNVTIDQELKYPFSWF